jgi:putative phosphoribosyl transferase
MDNLHIFDDRTEAGRVLANKLSNNVFFDPLILALPRGGVPVAKEIALELRASMDVLVVRKIGAPYNEEYGIGAMCEDYFPLFNEEARRAFSAYSDEIDRIVSDEKKELKRRIAHYRGTRKLPKIEGRSVILVDDGIATGISATAAAKYIRGMSPREIIIASPVCSSENSQMLTRYADQIICLNRPHPFSGVGQWYRDFRQVSDSEVTRTLSEFHPLDSSEATYV